MEYFDDVLANQQKSLNEAIEKANYDLTHPAVIAASMEYDRLVNDRMGL